MKKIILGFIMLLSFLGYFKADASLSISPLRFEFEINENSSKQENLKLTNRGDSTITVYSVVEDFIAGDDEGNPKFVNPGDDDAPEYSLSNWVTINERNITLAPGETREITFSVNVPNNPEPGGHYAAIFFSPGIPGGSQVALVQRVGALLLVDVPGEVNIEGNVKSFKIGEIIQESFSEKNDFKDFPIVFQTIFENKGNTHLKPRGKVTLLDENGDVIRNVGKEEISSPSGAYLGNRSVDYIPINSNFGNVLPKSERRFETKWEGFGYSVLNDDGTRDILFKTPGEYYADEAAKNTQFLMPWQSINTRTVNKKITAVFELSFEGKDRVRQEFNETKEITIKYQESYVGVSYIFVSIIILLLSLGVFYFIKIAPKNKAKKEEELRKKIIEEMNKSKK